MPAMIVPIMNESLRQRAEIRALLRLNQNPDAGLADLERRPATFRSWHILVQQGGNEQGVVENLMGQAWHTMSQRPDHFQRWLTWWSDRWDETVLRNEPAGSTGNQDLARLLPMGVWCRPSPSLPADRPWNGSLLRFWQRLAEHDPGWFERPAIGSESSQMPEFDTLGFNPAHDTVTNAMGVAVAHGRWLTVQAWEALGASWTKLPQGQKSWAVSPVLVALVRPDAYDRPVVRALGTPNGPTRWDLTWGHANTTRQQALGWKPDWLLRTARGTLWDVAVQHPDLRVNEQAYRTLLASRPSVRQKNVRSSGLPEAVLNAHLRAAEALVLRDQWPSDVGPAARSRPRL